MHTSNKRKAIAGHSDPYTSRASRKYDKRISNRLLRSAHRNENRRLISCPEADHGSTVSIGYAD